MADMPDEPDLIVWPESALPKFYGTTVKNYKMDKQFNQIPLIFGLHLVEYKPGQRSQNVYNSVVLVDGDGKKIDHYHKKKLLPLIESGLFSGMHPLGW